MKIALMHEMKITNLQRKQNIIKNIDYLLKSRKETKSSFSEKCGLTRAALHNIIDGRVDNVQRSTITRISQFFSISCDEIEYFDLAEIEKKREKMAVDGNKNPSAVPVIPESVFLSSLKRSIGFLIMEYPLTYVFNDESEVVAMQIENDFCENFSPGDILIIKRISVSGTGLSELYITSDNKFKIKFIDEINPRAIIRNEKLLGCIIEERRQT